MICLSCIKDVNALYSKGLCRACYNYFKDGGTVNPLPEAGTIAYDERGYVDGINEVNVNIVFEPEWNKDMMSEEAKLELGFL